MENKKPLEDASAPEAIARVHNRIGEKAKAAKSTDRHDYLAAQKLMESLQSKLSETDATKLALLLEQNKQAMNVPSTDLIQSGESREQVTVKLDHYFSTQPDLQKKILIFAERSGRTLQEVISIFADIVTAPILLPATWFIMEKTPYGVLMKALLGLVMPGSFRHFGKEIPLKEYIQGFTLDTKRRIKDVIP